MGGGREGATAFLSLPTPTPTPTPRMLLVLERPELGKGSGGGGQLTPKVAPAKGTVSHPWKQRAVELRVGMYRFFLAETQALRVTWAMLLLLFGLVLGTWRDVCLGSEGGLDALWALSLRPHPTPARASVEHAHAPPFPQPLVRDQGGHSPGARALGLCARSAWEVAGSASSGAPGEVGKVCSSERQFCSSGRMATWAQGWALRDSWSRPRSRRAASPDRHWGLSLCSPSPAPLFQSPSTWHFQPPSLGGSVEQGARDHPPPKEEEAQSQRPPLKDVEGYELIV